MAVKQVCPNCGWTGKPIKHTKGSLGIEIILWLLFLIPGIIYTIWRHATRSWVCPSCLNPQIVPANSPRGQELLKKYGK